MKLVAQHYPPVLLERGRRRLAEQRGHAGQRLGRDQRTLGPAVQELGAALSGQRATVQLEIHLTDPDRQLRIIRHVGACLGEPVGDRHWAQRWHHGKVRELRLTLEHLLGRPATAITETEGQQALWMMLLATIVLPGLQHRPRPDLGIVAIDRVVEGVCQNPATVEPLPPEQVAGHRVGL